MISGAGQSEVGRRLFRDPRRLLTELGPALELGRSFVAPEFQRDFQPLLLLWRGIGALVAAVPTAYMEAGSGYVELALALHLVLAVEAAARWWTTGNRLALAYVAVFVGYALAVKLLAVFVLLSLGLLVLLRARRVDADPGARPATELLTAGIDLRTVAGRLGHTNGATTLRVYAAWRDDADKKAAAVLGGRMQRPPSLRSH